MTKNKYIICDPYEMNSYYKEGYIFLTSFNITNSSYSTVATNHSGQMLGTDYSYYGNAPVPQISSNTRIIMELSKQAEILYGEKCENNA